MIKMFDKQINWLIKFDKRSISYKEKKDDLVLGLVLGLVVGLVWGLVWGLVVGLVSLISVSLIASIKYFPFKIWLLIISIIIVAELIFLLFDKKKPKKKENKFWFTVKRKGISYIPSTFVWIESIGAFELGKRGIPYIRKYYPEIVKWLGYVGITIIVIAIILTILYGYIKLNSLKYKE